MSSGSGSQKKGLLHKRWFQVCGVGLCVLPLLFILGIYGVKSYLVDWLQENGAETAAIDKLSVNPFLGSVTLKGLDVQVGGKSLLKNSDMVLNVGFVDLFKKNITVQKALYSGLVLDLEQFADGSFRVGSYTIKKSGEKAVEETSDKEPTTWAFLADQVDLENCLVKVKTPDLDFKLLLEKVELRKFTTREGRSSATFLLVGQLNEQPLKIDLSELQVNPSLSLKGNLYVSKFQLTEIASLLKNALPTFSGDVGIDGTVDFALGGEGGIEVEYSGLIDVIQPDIGSDSFATRADNLRWQGDVHFKSVNDEPMIVITDGSLAASEYGIKVPAADFVSTESLIELKGKNTVTIAENVLVENNGSLLIEKADVVLPGTRIEPEHLLWQGLVTHNSNNAGAGQYVAAKGALQLGPLAFALGDGATGSRMHSQDLAWKGDVVYGQEPNGSGSYVQLAGKLNGNDIGADLPDSMKIGQQTLLLTADSIINFGDTLDIKGTNSLSLGNFSFDGGADGPKVGLGQLDIQGLEGLGNQNLRLAQLTTAGLSVALAGNLPLDIRVPAIEINGFLTEDLANFNVESIALEQTEIVSAHNGEQLLHLDEIKANELLFDESQHLSAGNLSLTKLIILGIEKDTKIQPVLTLEDGTLSGIKWAGSDGFTGESLHFTDLVTTLIKDKEGELNLSKRLAAMMVNSEEQEEKGEVADKNDKGMPIRLGEITVKGNSHVKFEDRALVVPYLTDLAIKKLELRNLDSTKPEEKSPFVLNGQFDERAPFNVEGDVSPFMAPLALHFDLSLKNYPLSKLSSYTVQSVGTSLASGQLKLITKFGLENDNLDMENEISLKKLETETISSDLAKELDNQLPIPLDAALSILRDSDRNITLNIPLTGPVSDLNVGIADVLTTALSKAIVPAASGYLMYTLGPYGALAYVGMKAGEKLLKVELPPVEFAPGEITITEDYKKYLEKVAEVLKGRPETDIQICPQVVSWDYMDEKQLKTVKEETVEVVEADQEKLDELGQQRAIAVQSYLVAEYGIEKSRLLLCDTLIATGKKDKPMVQLNL